MSRRRAGSGSSPATASGARGGQTVLSCAWKGRIPSSERGTTPLHAAGRLACRQSLSAAGRVERRARPRCLFCLPRLYLTSVVVYAAPGAKLRGLRNCWEGGGPTSDRSVKVRLWAWGDPQSCAGWYEDVQRAPGQTLHAVGAISNTNFTFIRVRNRTHHKHPDDDTWRSSGAHPIVLRCRQLGQHSSCGSATAGEPATLVRGTVEARPRAAGQLRAFDARRKTAARTKTIRSWGARAPRHAGMGGDGWVERVRGRGMRSPCPNACSHPLPPRARVARCV